MTNSGAFDSLKRARQAPNEVRFLDLYLEWRDGGLEALPEDLNRFRNLETLVIRGLNVESLPDGLVKHPTVRALHFASNQMETVPPQLFELQRLEVLSIVDNAIESLPDRFDRLPGLRDLEVRRTQLRTLPPSLCRAAALERLVLRANELTSLPEGMSVLKRLRVLDLQENALTPDVIAAFGRWVDARGRSLHEGV